MIIMMKNQATGEERAVVTAAIIRTPLDDAVAARAEDAVPAREQPGEIAPKDVVLVFGIGELEPFAWKVERYFNHDPVNAKRIGAHLRGGTTTCLHG